jgi:hypothetical protein
LSDVALELPVVIAQLDEPQDERHRRGGAEDEPGALPAVRDIRVNSERPDHRREQPESGGRVAASRTAVSRSMNATATSSSTAGTA